MSAHPITLLQRAPRRASFRSPPPVGDPWPSSANRSRASRSALRPLLRGPREPSRRRSAGGSRRRSQDAEQDVAAPLFVDDAEELIGLGDRGCRRSRSSSATSTGRRRWRRCAASAASCPELAIVAVSPPATATGVRRGLDAGADAIVFEPMLESTLAVTVSAVGSGQAVVPRELRASVQRPDPLAPRATGPHLRLATDSPTPRSPRALPLRKHGQEPPLLRLRQVRRPLPARGRSPLPRVRPVHPSASEVTT